MSRVALHFEETNEDYHIENHVTPTGVGTVPLPALIFAINRLLDRLYWAVPLPQKPITEKHVPKDERNQQICARFALGDSLQAIADDFDVSVQRISQLIHRWCS